MLIYAKTLTRRTPSKYPVWHPKNLGKSVKNATNRLFSTLCVTFFDKKGATLVFFTYI